MVNPGQSLVSHFRLRKNENILGVNMESVELERGVRGSEFQNVGATMKMNGEHSLNECL